jgi:undecaprenyl-diphosphatase
MNFGSWDTALLFQLNSIAGHSALTDAIIVFTASYLPYIVVGLFVFYLYHQRRLTLNLKIQALTLSLLAAIVARFGIGSPVRFFFPRPRPFVTLPVHQLIAESSVGFPSGHALFFFSFSTVVYVYNKSLGLFLFFLSVIICVARVAAGVHYPSDIITGAVLGTLCGFVTVRVARRMRVYLTTSETSFPYLSSCSK